MRSSESGFGLVNVLMILGAVLLAILLLSRSQVNLRMAGKSLDAVNSYEVFISSFTDFVQASVKNNITELCAGQTVPLQDLSFGGKKASLSLAAGSPAEARCGKTLLNTDGRMYFCLQLEKNPAFPKDSFGGAEQNYAEIAVRAVNKWQQPITCQDYKASTTPDVGLQIYYRLYWSTKQQAERYFQKYGYFYAIKE